MLDKIVKIDRNTVMLVFDDRRPVRVTNDSQNPEIFALWLLSDTKLTLQEFETALNQEETVVIKAG